MSEHIYRVAEMLERHIAPVAEGDPRIADGLHLARALAAAGHLATPTHDAEVAAKAWDEGYAVGEDNFIHSDYCGMRGCQCQGPHGTTNPYLPDGNS